MEKKAYSRSDGCTAENISPLNCVAQNQDKNPLFMVKKQTAVLTSLLGTQLLLTTSPPDYPIIKVVEAVPEEVS